MRSPVIYVAGPLSGESAAVVEAHIAAADRTGFLLVQKCHALNLPVRVLIPHNNTGHWLLNRPVMSDRHRDQVMQECLDWVCQADLLVYLGDSPGALQELDEALIHDVPVIDLRVSALATVAAWVVNWYRDHSYEEAQDKNEYSSHQPERAH